MAARGAFPVRRASLSASEAGSAVLNVMQMSVRKMASRTSSKVCQAAPGEGRNATKNGT